MAQINDPDVEMVRLAQGGDSAAFDYLVLRYQGRVQSILRRYLQGDADAIADATQEVFISAWKALPRFQGKSRFYTWLFSITVNMAKDTLSAQKRRRSFVREEPEDDPEWLNIEDEDSPSPEAIHISQQEQAIVSAALQKMSGTLKEALCLREYEDLSYEEIASILDCPINTVRTRIFRARAALAELLQSDGRSGAESSGTISAATNTKPDRNEKNIPKRNKKHPEGDKQKKAKRNTGEQSSA